MGSTLILVMPGLDKYTADGLAKSLERQGVHSSRVEVGMGFSDLRVEVEVSADNVANVARLMDDFSRHMASV